MIKAATLVVKGVQHTFYEKTQPSGRVRKQLAFMCVFLLQLL